MLRNTPLRKTFVPAFMLAMLALAAPAQAQDGSGTAHGETVYLFTSFRGDGDGLHLAWSEDGYDWNEIPGTFLEPQVGSGLMRDPDILVGPDGSFHMVWTTGWGDDGFGYARSENLMDWSEQQYVPVMAEAEGDVSNTWAPELFYDDTREQYMVTWSSEVEGRFPETVSETRMNNRTYYVTTADFETFSEPRLLFDPGFDHIDATIVDAGERYVMLIKEGDRQSVGDWGPVHLAEAQDPQGPWTLLDEKVIEDARVEGPALARVGDDWVVYMDYYSEGRYGARRTQDFGGWTEVTERLDAVEGQRHGSVIEVERAVLEGLLATLDPAAVDPTKVPSATLPGLFADPHAVEYDGTFYIYPTSDGHEGWGSNSFSVFSSDDLQHWRSHGLILHFPTDLEWADERAWAPAAIRRDGTYYFYYSANRNIGVAVADRPAGPFTDPLGEPLVAEGAYEGQMIDPAAFIDDDGQAWLYWGNGRCYVAPLEDDMITLAGPAKDITPPGFREGAIMLKREGTYYLMWSEDDTRSPDYRVAYGTGTSPTGPFTKAENNPILIGEGIIQGTGHHSVVKHPEADHYYIVYHRHSIPQGTGFKRETVIGDLVFGEDGTIRKVDVTQPFTPLDEVE